MGLAVGSFFSVSLDPPLVGFCVADRRRPGPSIAGAGHFGVNVLADDQTESGRFASKVEDKFEGVDWYAGTGDRVAADRRLPAHIDCELEAFYDGGDHEIVIGLVRALDVHRDEVGPLLFFKGSYGRLGSI